MSPSSGRVTLPPSRARSLARSPRPGRWKWWQWFRGPMVVAGGVRSSSSARAICFAVRVIPSPSPQGSCRAAVDSICGSSPFCIQPTLNEYSPVVGTERAVTTGPPTSRSVDHARSIELAFAALHFATLRDGRRLRYRGWPGRRRLYGATMRTTPTTTTRTRPRTALAKTTAAAHGGEVDGRGLEGGGGGVPPPPPRRGAGACVGELRFVVVE